MKRLTITTTVVLLVTAGLPVLAQTKGMVVDNASRHVTVFDADTYQNLGSVALGDFDGTAGDCTISADGKLGFVTSFTNNVRVIDLTGNVPALASSDPIVTNTPNLEDGSLSSDGKYLLVCDGSNATPQPVSVIDLTTYTAVGSLTLSSDCTSVEVCKDNSVLVTLGTGDVRKIQLNAGGTLTDSGPTLSPATTGALNAACSPTSKWGIAADFNNGIYSFGLSGMTGVSSLTTEQNAQSVIVNPAGNQVIVRRNVDSANGAIDFFNLDDSTGALSATSSISILAGATPYGIDQIALNSAGTKLYVSQPSAVRVYDLTANGNLVGSVTGTNMYQPAGVCIGPPDAPACTAPVMSALSATPSMLWPPNHKMNPITLNYSVDYKGCPGTCQVSVAVNTSVPGTYWQQVDDHHLYVVADSNTNGTARVYAITITCQNSAHQTSTETATVTVPKSQGN